MCIYDKKNEFHRKIFLLHAIHYFLFYTILFFNNKSLNAKQDPQNQSPLMSNKPPFEKHWFKGLNEITKIEFTL